MVLGYEFPSPEVVSERAKTDTSGYRNYRENLRFLREIIHWTKKGGKFWYGFTYPNSSQITILINFAKQLLPTWTVKDESYICNFSLYSSSSDHTFIVVIPFEHHTMPVERKHKCSVETLCPNILSQFHCSELDRIRHKIRAKAYRNSDKSSPNTKPIKQLQFY